VGAGRILGPDPEGARSDEKPDREEDLDRFAWIT
jgi:hypothetical protein